MLETLTQLHGVAGYEQEVRKFIWEKAEAYADKAWVDAIGNLIVLKEGTGEKKKKIMLSAHMDEIGYQVTKIEGDGRIKVCSLGWLWTASSYNNRVVFTNGTVGVVSCEGDIHEIRQDTTSLYIDIGCKTKEETLKYVNIGDVCGYIGPYMELAGDHICSKSLDDRAGCYQLLEALKRNKGNYNDCYYVFSVQEELGCRGAKTAAARIRPDIGVAVDITPAHDYPCDLKGSNSVGDGIGVKFSDPSVVCDPYLVKEMVSCCEENQISWQREVIDKGGTDAGSMAVAYQGARTTGISLVTRYPHSPCSVISRGDLEAGIDLIHYFTDRIFEFEEVCLK